MKGNPENDSKVNDSSLQAKSSFFHHEKTCPNTTITNPYQAFAQLLLGPLKPIVGNAYFLSALHYKFLTCGYPEYNSSERHGQWGQSKHVRWGKINRLYPLYSFNHIQPIGHSLPQFVWYPSLQYIGLASDFEASFHVEVGGVISQSEYSQKEVLFTFNVVPPGLRDVNYIQGDGPRNVPSRLVGSIQESVLNAVCRGAYNYGTRAVESSTAQHSVQIERSR